MYVDTFFFTSKQHGRRKNMVSKRRRPETWADCLPVIITPHLPALIVIFLTCFLACVSICVCVAFDFRLFGPTKTSAWEHHFSALKCIGFLRLVIVCSLSYIHVVKLSSVCYVDIIYLGLFQLGIKANPILLDLVQNILFRIYVR